MATIATRYQGEICRRQNRQKHSSEVFLNLRSFIIHNIFKHTLFSSHLFFLVSFKHTVLKDMMLSSLMSPLSLLSHFYILLSFVLCLKSHISCFLSNISGLMSYVSCLISPVFCLINPAICLMSHISYPMSPVTCLLSHV